MKTFGIKDPSLSYYTRTGVYLIAFSGESIVLVQTPKGYFLPGGGLHPGETHEECIRRECLEELGYAVSIKGLLTEAEMYTIHPVIGPFHPVQYYYTGTLTEKITVPAEPDHVMVLLPRAVLDPGYPEYQKYTEKFVLPCQLWAVEKVLE